MKSFDCYFKNAGIEFHKNGEAVDEKWISVRDDGWCIWVNRKGIRTCMTLKIESTYETVLVTNHIATIMCILQKAKYFYLSWSVDHCGWIRHMHVWWVRPMSLIFMIPTTIGPMGNSVKYITPNS